MYNCYTKETWDDEKTAWCCENKKMGCSAPVYDPCADKKEAEKCSLCDPAGQGMHGDKYLEVLPKRKVQADPAVPHTKVRSAPSGARMTRHLRRPSPRMGTAAWHTPAVFKSAARAVQAAAAVTVD